MCCHSWCQVLLYSLSFLLEQSCIFDSTAKRGHSNNTWHFLPYFSPLAPPCDFWWYSSVPPYSFSKVSWGKISFKNSKKMSRGILLHPLPLHVSFSDTVETSVECHILFEWPLTSNISMDRFVDRKKLKNILSDTFMKD